MFMVMVMLIVIVVVIVVIAVMVVTIVSVVTVVMLMRSIPARSIAVFVFFRSHKIHGSIARVILVAVPAPVLRVLRRYMQVYGLDAVRFLRWLIDENRLRVHQSRRRPVGQIHPAVNSGYDLPRYRQADIQVAGSHRGRGHPERAGEQRQAPNHLVHPNPSLV